MQQNMETTDYNKIAMKLAPLLHALAHPARLQIMLHLAKYNGCQAGSISGKLPLSKSTVSQHLSKLRAAGLINCIADGNYSKYTISDIGYEIVKANIGEFINLMEYSIIKRSDCCPSNQKNTRLFAAH